MFKVGQKVVCVDDIPEIGCEVPLCVERGEVYTVGRVIVDPIDGELCVYFFEVVRPICDVRGFEAPLRPSRFRPFQETGMEMLRAILIQPNAPVKENA